MKALLYSNEGKRWKALVRSKTLCIGLEPHVDDITLPHARWVHAILTP